MSDSAGSLSGMLVVRQVTDPRDPAIAGFGRMQRAAYFAPETLIPADYVPQMIVDGGHTGSRRNFLVVAEMNERVVGGTLFHWLAEAGSGFSSFMGVDRELRGRGIARRMHQERFRVLDEAAGGRAPGVFIDVVNPTRMSKRELERERRVGSDPWDRRRVFARLGFGQVDIRYEQPVGGPSGGPVTVLDLLYCPRDPADWVPTALVVATMEAYWSPWLGKMAARHHAQELEARAAGRAMLALVSPVTPRPPSSGEVDPGAGTA
jgi:GNAT superfamily N-acetyltransferase